MRRLVKKDLQLRGSAGTVEDLKSLMKERLYWSTVEITPSVHYTSKLGNCYDVANLTGVVSKMVVLHRKGRWSLYWILE